MFHPSTVPVGYTAIECNVTIIAVERNKLRFRYNLLCKIIDNVVV